MHDGYLSVFTPPCLAYDLPGDRGTVKSMLRVYPKRLTLTASSSIDLSFHDIESLKLMS